LYVSMKKRSMVSMMVTLSHSDKSMV
jgi:hypothetical protein